MWAVYLCGATDCFLHACFTEYGQAEEWAIQFSNNPEGFMIKEWPSVSDISISDTGWNKENHIIQKDGD